MWVAMGRQGKAYLSGLVAVLLWSTVASAFKLSLRRLDFIQLLCYSSMASTILLGAILAARGRLGDVRGLTGRQYARALLLGALNPFLYYLILFRAYELLPAQMAQPLNYTWAIALALLSVPLLRQRLGWREIAAGAVGYFGVIVISTKGDLATFRTESPLGVGLALGSAVIWAVYWIVNTKDERDPVTVLFLNFLFGLPLVVAACAVFSSLRVSDPLALLGAAYVGIVEMGVAFVLWLTALRLSDRTAKVGYLIFLAPFLSLVFIRRLVGETILLSTVVGLALIVVALLLQRTSGRPDRIEVGAGDRGAPT